MPHKQLVFVGQKFANLTVLRQASPNGNGSRRWICACVCGKHSTCEQQNLRTGHTTSCGCRRSEVSVGTHILPPGQSYLNSVFSITKANAKRRQREFTLTKAEFLVLIQSSCYYCGCPPVLHGWAGNPKRDGTMRFNGIVAVHGVDRKDNSLGYVLGNCVPCCAECNYAKRQRSYVDFMTWIQRVFQHTKSLGLAL